MEEKEEEEEIQPVKVRTRNSVKKRLTLVVVGHVDAGKSTLMGHLLYVVSCVRAQVFESEARESHFYHSLTYNTLTRITFITHLLITLTRITFITQLLITHSHVSLLSLTYL